MSIDAEFILKQGSLVQGLTLDAARAAELAEEVRALNAASVTASQTVEFEDDPSCFVGLLWQLRDQ